MIVEMSRVLVVGPKRLLAPALESLQGVGSLHVDRIEAEEAPEVFSAPAPESAERAQADALERLRGRVDGLLTLLPHAAVEPAPATADLADRPVEELEAELATLEERTVPLTRRRLEFQDELELIRSYESTVRVLSPLLGALAGSHVLESVGFILRARDLSIVQDVRRRLVELTGGRVEVVSRQVEEGKMGVVVAFHRRDAEAVHGFLARAGISELRLPSVYAGLPPAEAIRRMDARRAALPGEIEGLNTALRRLAEEKRSRLIALRAVIQDRLARIQVVPQLAQSRYTFVVHGWTPTRMVSAIRRNLQKRFGTEVMLYDTPADPHEAERVPVLLDNPGAVRPFQMLLALFPPPRYGTMDPTLLISITFPFFVGLVIGDVGYGILFFLFGWVLRNRARAGQSIPGDPPRGVLDKTARFLGLRAGAETLGPLSWLIRVLAVWVIVFGVIYAEVFGNLPELFFHVKPIFNRVEEQGVYFRIILLIGVGMIFLGLLGHLVMAIRHRHRRGIAESLVTLFTLLGILIFLGTTAGMLPAALARWSLYLLLAAIGAFLAAGRPSLLWFLESFSAFGHVLSHARLMAFGLAAAILATAANALGPEMARQFGVRGIIGAILGTIAAGGFQILFFLFTIIGHIIQPARLHWVELLTKLKYHEESGPRYQPFRKVGGGEVV